MNLRKRFRACALSALLLMSLPASLHAAGGAKAAPKTTQKSASASKGGPHAGRFGIVFGIDAPNLGIQRSADGFQPGAGCILDLSRNLSLRGLLTCTVAWPATGYSLNSGLSAALLWRPITGKKAVPYLGGLFGSNLSAAPGGALVSIYGGLLAGAELRIGDNFSVYADYRVIAKNTPVDGIDVGIGADGNPGFGFIVYFP